VGLVYQLLSCVMVLRVEPAHSQEVDISVMLH